MSGVILRAQFSSRFTAEGPWNQIFPRGEWHGANLDPIGGSIVIDDGFMSEIVANWVDAGRPPLPIRKTHQHLEAEANPIERLELERAYGFLTDMRVTAEGLEVKTEWNAAGEAEVKSGSFAFWSPEWQPKHVDRRTGETKGWWLGGVALCNSPFFNSMPRVAASTDAGPTHNPVVKGNTMKPELLARLRAALKCAAECNDEDLVAAAEAFGKPVEPDGDEAEKMAAAVTAAVSPMQTQLTAAAKQIEALTAKAAAAEAAVLERDVETLLTSAKHEGKAVEPLREFVLAAAKRDGIESAKKLVAALPATVALKEAGISGEKPTDDATVLAASVKEYGEKLSAYATAKGMPVASAAHLFNRENPELAKRAFTKI